MSGNKILVASELGEIGFAILAAYAHAGTPTSNPNVRIKLEDLTKEALVMQPLYDQVQKYVARGLLAAEGIAKNPETGRSVDLYRITPAGLEAVAAKVEQMKALLDLEQKLRPERPTPPPTKPARQKEPAKQKE